MAQEPREVGGPSVEELRSQIAHTRAEMTETIDAIQERLRPRRLVNEAKETVREATIGRATQVMRSVTARAGEVAGRAPHNGDELRACVRDNPLSTTLVGAAAIVLSFWGLRKITRSRARRAWARNEQHLDVIGKAFGGPAGYGRPRENTMPMDRRMGL